MSTTSCTVVAGRQVPVCFIVGHPTLPRTAGHSGHPLLLGQRAAARCGEGLQPIRGIQLSPLHSGWQIACEGSGSKYFRPWDISHHCRLTAIVQKNQCVNKW